MIVIRRPPRATLFVDRSSQRWVVLDPEGQFWILPNSVNPWDKRESFVPTDQTVLEPVPGHYRFMLGLPI